MPNIDQDLQRIMEARYGREVRGSIHDAISDINDVADGAYNKAATAQDSAESSAKTASELATLAESYTKGGTGTRTGENTDNAKYYNEQALIAASAFPPGGSTGQIMVKKSNTNHDVEWKNPISVIPHGQPNTLAELDDNGRVPYSQLPESAMEFKGTWDAATNTPELIQGGGTNGDFYVVSVGGTWEGIMFSANDRVLFDGTNREWIRLAAGEVSSVNGKSGVVELTADDIDVNSTYTVGDVLGAIPTGGTTGQVLVKASNSNYNTEWVDNEGGADYTVPRGAIIYADVEETPEGYELSGSPFDGALDTASENAVRNGVVASAINQLRSDLSDSKKNNFGTGVNIKSYNTPANKYVCPSDGYIRLNCTHSANDDGRVSVYGNSDEQSNWVQIRAKNNHNYTNSIYVRKGMKVLAETINGTPEILFVPLV